MFRKYKAKFHAGRFLRALIFKARAESRRLKLSPRLATESLGAGWVNFENFDISRSSFSIDVETRVNVADFSIRSGVGLQLVVLTDEIRQTTM